MKKRISTLLALTLALALCLGCFSFAQAEDELTGEITFTAWNTSYVAAVEAAKQFMEAHPGATINIEQIPDNNKLYTQLATGIGVPDIMQFQNRDMQTALAKYPGAFLDLTDAIAAKANDIVPAVLPLLMDGDAYYGYPWDIAPALMFYRADIYDEYGVDYTEIKTWDDFIAAGKIINEGSNGEIKSFGFDYNGTSSFDMPLIIFYQGGGSFMDQEGNVQFNTPEVKTAYSIVSEMMDADLTVNLPNEWTDRITALANDQLCAVSYGVWFAGTLQDNLADQAGKWAVMPLPAIPESGKYQANSGGSTVMVSAQTEYPELCNAFLDWFLLSNEGCAINMSVASLFNSYIPAFEDESYKVVDDYFGISVAEFATQVSEEIPPLPFPAFFTDVGIVFQNNAIGQYFIDNQDIDAVLDNATQIAQNQLDFLKD